MKTPSLRAFASAALISAALLAPAHAAQDRSQLKVPSGLSFAEFKGYESWQPVAVSQVPGSQKLIAANPVMMAAYRKGLPANGQKFPDGSRVVKIEWTQKPNAASPYPVQVPDRLASVAFIVKDLKRFPKTNGWAYAKFDMDPKTGNLKPEGSGAACGYACHTAVAAQDYIFTAYPPR
jgi:hypothetical protein